MATHAQDPGRRAPQPLLAKSVTRFVHDTDALARALTTTGVLFGGGDWSELSAAELDAGMRSAPSHTLPRAVLGTPEALLLNQLAGEGRPFKSKTEARGFVERGAVSNNNVGCCRLYTSDAADE